MTKRPSIAVVGCGYWGKNHARTLASLNALSAVCDLNEKNVKVASKTHDVPAITFDTLLTDKSIEGAVLALPPHLHEKHAVALLNAGKHVLVEKPIGLNTAEAERVVDAAKKSGTIAMTGHILRYHSAFEKMYSIFQSGDLGELKYIHSHRVGLGKFHPKNDALWDIAPHDLSLILAITGTSPTKIHGEGAATLNELSDFAHLHLTFPNNVKAHVFVSRLNPYRERRLTIVGSRAMMSFDDALPWNQKLALYKHNIWQDDTGWQSEMVDPEYITVDENMPLTKELEDFLHCIETGDTPRTPIEDGLEIVKILEAGTITHSSTNA